MKLVHGVFKVSPEKGGGGGGEGGRGKRGEEGWRYNKSLKIME